MGAGHPEDQAVIVCVCAKLCYVHLSVILWAVAQQVRLSKGFSRQEYQSGLPCPLPGDLSNLGIEPASLMSPALAGRFFTTSTTWKDLTAATAAKSLQSCLALCDPIDGSPPGSPVPGTLQARILEWVAISFSNA